jgi:predicted nuclease of predicted toxin-antitoxin system
MKIIIDENISSRLVGRIQHVFPDVEHVKTLGLMTVNDFNIFMFARQNGYDAVLTLDEDFYNIQLTHGVPPKIIWLRVGNCSTIALTETIMSNVDTIYAFLFDPNLECLEIYK